MKRLIVFIIVVFSTIVFSQTVKLDGTITDMENGQVLKNVNVQIQNSDKGAISNTKGDYELFLDNGELYEITFSHIGYKKQTKKVRIETTKNIRLDIQLKAETLSGSQVVVTSSRYEKEIKDVAQPMSVVGKQRIQETSPIDISNAMDREPGLSISKDGAWGSHVALRGLSRNNVVFLIDGNRVDTATDMAAAMSMIDINDVEQIEVIKGAASSLYGTGAIGGVVNILTQNGWYSDQFYIKEQLTGGYSSVNNSGIGQAAITAGASKWYLRLSGMARNADDVDTPEGIIPNSQFHDENTSVKLGIRPFINHEINVNYQKFYAQDVGIPGAYPVFPSNATVTYPEEEREMLSAKYTAHFQRKALSSLSLKYFKQDIVREVINEPYIVNHIPASEGSPAKNANVLSVTPGALHETQGVQLQSDWIFNGNNHLVAGIDAWQKDLSSHREKNIRIDVLSPNDTIIKSISQVVGEQPLPDAWYRSIGVYAQDEFTLAKKLDISIGGRYDKINVENEQVLNPLYQIVDGVRNDAPANQTVLWNATSAGDQSWSGNLGLLYHLLPDFDLALSLGKAFRSPYLEERYQYIDQGSLVKIGNPDLEPEQGNFVNAGLRIWKDRFTFSTDVFYNNMTNLVVESPGTFEGKNALYKTNVGKAELYGIEAQTAYTFNRLFSVFGNVAYVHGQDTYNDTPLPLVPPINGKLGATGSLKLINYELVANLYGKQDQIADWETETEGYAYYNAYLRTNHFHWLTFTSYLLAGIENITNNSYRNHLSTNRGLVTIEPGRNFIIRLQLSH